MKSSSKIGCSRDEQLLSAMAEAGAEFLTQGQYPTPLEMVKEFAECMEQPLYEPWCHNLDLEGMRFKLIAEEYSEVAEESAKATDAEAMLKELADLVYVVNGYCATYGWDLDEAIRRVHASNMSKMGDDGKPLYRHDGKVLKGPNYTTCDLSELVERIE